MPGNLAVIPWVRGAYGRGFRRGVVCHAQVLELCPGCVQKWNAVDQGQMKRMWWQSSSPNKRCGSWEGEKISNDARESCTKQ